jgi:ATP-dependent Zn protease
MTQKPDRVVPRWLSIAIFVSLTVLIIAAVGFVAMQATRGTPMGYAQFLADVQGGQVTKVEQEGDVLTVSEGANRYEVVVPSILTDVHAEMQSAASKGGAALPSEVYVAVSSPDTSLLGLVITGLLPLALIIIVFGFVVYILARRGEGHPDASSRLKTVDSAWKAGLLTDQERERKRTEIIEGI